MSYITREDGEHFVIPSYRDVLAAKNKSALKKEILLLSQNYGEFITLQRKSPTQYEVAFSPDTGYLLGESIWHYFKRPLDMIYCEAIPNTTEAILVIVKAGSVYLDGSFPLDSIPEELVIFLTQQNNFEIYIHGNVPISQTPEEGKFSFEPNSIKSFTVLEQPVFPTLPLLKMYQLQPVEVVLKAQGIGVFPLRQVLTILIVLILLWLAWSYLTARREAAPEQVTVANPYKPFNDRLATTAPDVAIQAVVDNLDLLYTMPGWAPRKIEFSNNNFSATVQSIGSKTEYLFEWARAHKLSVNIKQDGIYVERKLILPGRPTPSKIYPLKETIGVLVDRLSTVYPGNTMTLGKFNNRPVYKDVKITVAFANTTPVVLSLIGEQFKDLPLALQSVTFLVSNGTISGSIIMEALGN